LKAPHRNAGVGLFQFNLERALNRYIPRDIYRKHRRAPLGSPSKSVDTLPVNTYNVFMSDLRFEWNEQKNKENKRKHGVSFEEAQTIFYDEYAVRYYDPDHSEDEDRFIMLGMSIRLRALIVCHCYRKDDNVIRIVSARKADRTEAKVYRR